MKDCCGAPHDEADVNGLYCELPEGHDGDHEANVIISWPEATP